MADDPATPGLQVVEDQEEVTNTHSSSGICSSPSLPRPSNSPTSSTPSNSPGEKGLKPSELLNSEESLVSPISTQEIYDTAVLSTKAESTSLSDFVEVFIDSGVGSDTPTVQADIGDSVPGSNNAEYQISPIQTDGINVRTQISPIQTDTVKTEDYPLTNQSVRWLSRKSFL